MDVVHKYEVLAHMKLGEDGIEHLAEIIPEEGGLEKIDLIPTFDVLEIHEKDEETGSYLASVNLTHSIPMMLSLIHISEPTRPY